MNSIGQRSSYLEKIPIMKKRKISTEQKASLRFEFVQILIRFPPAYLSLKKLSLNSREEKVALVQEQRQKKDDCCTWLTKFNILRYYSFIFA